MFQSPDAMTSTVYRIPGHSKKAWHISNILSRPECDDAKMECLVRSSAGSMRRSETPSKREYVINTEFSLYVAYRTLPFIEGLLKQSCCVLHTFTSLYDAGDVLEPHVDREPLDWTVSIMLGDDTSSAEGRELLSLGDQAQPVSICGSDGDGVLFPGHDVLHWRQAQCPHRLAMLLIHYAGATAGSR